MSSIDKYWSDRLIYHIGFIANVSKTNSLVEKRVSSDIYFSIKFNWNRNKKNDISQTG